MPIAEALLSLNGLSTGDAFGEQFYRRGLGWIVTRHLPPGPWRWTDDTHMALSILEVLRDHGHIDQDALAEAFARRFREESNRGYAQGARHLLARLSLGEDWRLLAPALFGGGSFGNGGAMRAAPIGGFYAGDPARAAHEARRSAEITHAHPEGQVGAMAVAAAAAIAARPDRLSGVDFLQEILPFLPESETRRRVELAQVILAGDLEEAVQRLGSGQQVSAQDTAPFCLWSAARHLGSYEEALWWTVTGLGDRDTTCAIVGGIVALSAGNIPAEWLRRREPLPPGF